MNFLTGNESCSAEYLDLSEASLFFLGCNIGSKFCELIKSCAPLWKMAVNREIKL